MVKLFTSGERDSSAAYCEPGWTERQFGSKWKCYKSIGVHRLDAAKDKCAELKASLPVPRNDREAADILATVDSFGLRKGLKT